MCSGSYFPPPVKAVPIPKKSGGTRVLGVPTISDRIAQTVVKRTLEPILEPVFDEDSYGYRPRRSAHDAIAVSRVDVSLRRTLGASTNPHRTMCPLSFLKFRFVQRD